jgi:hypothetical protein
VRQIRRPFGGNEFSTILANENIDCCYFALVR